MAWKLGVPEHASLIPSQGLGDNELQAESGSSPISSRAHLSTYLSLFSCCTGGDHSPASLKYFLYVPLPKRSVDLLQVTDQSWPVQSDRSG